MTKPVSVQHVAGRPIADVQRCERCGVVLIDHQLHRNLSSEFLILADRSVGIYALLRNVVHARRQNISALPSSLGSAEDTLG